MLHLPFRVHMFLSSTNWSPTNTHPAPGIVLTKEQYISSTFCQIPLNPIKSHFPMVFLWFSYSKWHQQNPYRFTNPLDTPNCRTSKINSTECSTPQWQSHCKGHDTSPDHFHENYAGPRMAQVPPQSRAVGPHSWFLAGNPCSGLRHIDRP